MARVTVEDCIIKEKNRFELVLLAAHRARALHNGEKSNIPKDNDKAAVVALREIADDAIHVDQLKEEIIKSNQMYYEDEQIDEELNENKEMISTDETSIDNENEILQESKESLTEDIENEELANIENEEFENSKKEELEEKEDLKSDINQSEEIVKEDL